MKEKYAAFSSSTIDFDLTVMSNTSIQILHTLSESESEANVNVNPIVPVSVEDSINHSGVIRKSNV